MFLTNALRRAVLSPFIFQGGFWGFQEGYWSWISGVVDNAIYPVLAMNYLLKETELA